MTPDIPAIRARHAAATEGPFRVEHYILEGHPTTRVVDSTNHSLATVHGEMSNRAEPDAAFIAHSWQDIAALLATVDVLVEALERMVKREVDGYTEGLSQCMCCLWIPETWRGEHKAYADEVCGGCSLLMSQAALASVQEGMA